jgi:hypothetical protein
MAVLVLALALAGLVAWVFASPARLVMPVGVALAAHPAATVAVTAAVVAVLVTVGTVIVWRSLADSGWSLVTVTRPAAGGVAS